MFKDIINYIRDEKNIKNFIENKGEFNIYFYSMKEKIEIYENKKEVVNELLDYIIENPNLYFGTPGPITSVLEKCGEYYVETLEKKLSNNIRSKKLWEMYTRSLHSELNSQRIENGKKFLDIAEKLSEEGILDEYLVVDDIRDSIE